MVRTSKKGTIILVSMSADDFNYLEEVHRKINAAFLNNIVHSRKVSLSLEFRTRLTELKEKYSL